MQLRPRRLNTGVAVLFMVGSTCFAVGAAPVYADAVGTAADLVTFFVGSLFFTSAGFAWLLQAQTPATVPTTPEAQDVPVRVRFLAWLPHDRGWAAAATLFPGTLAFNVTTFAALAVGLSAREEDRKVWRPDFVGSILFLVSSTFAILALEAGHRAWAPREWAWWIAWLNMVGSIFFMASAIGSYVLPSTGSYINSVWSDAGTFLGALCFFAAAAMMILWWRSEVDKAA